MSKLNLYWESQSAPKKSFFIGLFAGVIWAIPATIGVFACNWNLLQWESSLSSLCNNEAIEAIFYFPFVLAQVGVFFLSYIIPYPPSEFMNIFLFQILPIIITVFIFSLIGMFIGWRIKKINY